MVIIYYSMIGTIHESKVMMHPNPRCRIIITCGMQPFRATIDMQLLALS
jgi:hypothetical protein